MYIGVTLLLCIATVASVGGFHIDPTSSREVKESLSPPVSEELQQPGPLDRSSEGLRYPEVTKAPVQLCMDGYWCAPSNFCSDVTGPECGPGMRCCKIPSQTSADRKAARKQKISVPRVVASATGRHGEVVDGKNETGSSGAGENSGAEDKITPRSLNLPYGFSHLPYNHPSPLHSGYGGSSLGGSYESVDQNYPYFGQPEVEPKAEKPTCGKATHIVVDHLAPGRHPGYPVYTKRTVDIEHPWQAAVLGSTVYGRGLRCGAVVVDPAFLLTSAKCLSEIQEPKLSAIVNLGLGLNNSGEFRSYEYETPVEKIYIHKKFNAHSTHHDVALLQLSQPLDLQQHYYLQPACLPHTNTTFKSDNCVILGWQDSYSGPVQSVLDVGEDGAQFVNKDEDCLEYLAPYPAGPSGQDRDLLETMHCVKTPKADNCVSPTGVLVCTAAYTDYCQTDACRYAFVAGLVTWSNRQCGVRGLAVVTEVKPYATWLREIIEAHYRPQYLEYGGQYLGYGGQYLGYGSQYPGYGAQFPGYAGSFVNYGGTPNRNYAY